MAAYFRSDFDPLPPLNYRKLAERALYQGKCGVGRMGLDFWEFPRKNRPGYVMDIYNRWPQSTCSQRRPTLMKLAWSAAEGPVPTVRFELLLEGLQEAEAMLFIADAAANQAGRLGAELVAECKRLQVDRINVARVVNGYRGVASGDYAGWQAASRRLYETAARVAKTLN